MISYREIQKRDLNAAELLLLLACFDNRDIWYQLLKGADNSSNIPTWLKNTISSGLVFKTSVKTLITFSLLETKLLEGSYAIHPVVQDWCHHITYTDKKVNSIQLYELALISVGYTIPSVSDRNYSELQRRLLPHANLVRHRKLTENNVSIWGAFNNLGNLYSDQGRLREAKEMYQRALAGREKALGPDHTSTLSTVNNLGVLYSNQGRLKEAEEMYQRALAGYEKALGPDHTSTLGTVSNLGILYKNQGRLKEAKEMYQRELPNSQEAESPNASKGRRVIEKIKRWIK
jgi:tetratricopeptide (TPR) repeat protein